MNKYEFNPRMREISGFGGEYENACRKMVIAGMEWLDQHPEAALSFQQCENIYGIITPTNAESIAFTDHICKACGENGPSGAMMHATVEHVMAAHKMGWDQYVKEMEKITD
jgi:hypothetical protein